MSHSKTKLTNGPLVVAALFVAAALASLGTCSQFTSDNPLASEIRFEGHHEVVAKFPSSGLEKIQPGMKAVLTQRGSKDRIEGRVVACKSDRVVVNFSDSLEDFSESGTRLTVDTTIPPALINPEPF